MSGESPAAVLFDSNGVEMAVVRGAPIPAGTRAYLFAGADGSGNVQILFLNADGSILASVPQPTTPTTNAVSQTSVSTTLLAANPARKGAVIYNDISNGFLYVLLGSGASPTDYSFKMAPGFYFELPFPAYTGQITGVWSVAGSGSARVTELV